MFVLGLVEVRIVVVVALAGVAVLVFVLGSQENADADPSPPPRHKQTHETDNTTMKETAYTSAARVSVKQTPEDKTGCRA